MSRLGGNAGEVRVKVAIDPSAIGPGMQAAKAEVVAQAADMQAAADQVGQQTGAEMAGGLAKGLKKAKKFITGTISGLLAAPYIAAEALHLGEKIGDSILVALGRAGSKAVEEAEKQAEEFQAKLAATFNKRAIDAKVTPVVDVEEVHKKLRELRAKLTEHPDSPVGNATAEFLGLPSAEKKIRELESLLGRHTAQRRAAEEEQQSAKDAEERRKQQADDQEEKLGFIMEQLAEQDRERREAEREAAQEAQRAEEEAMRDAQEQSARIYDEFITELRKNTEEQKRAAETQKKAAETFERAIGDAVSAFTDQQNSTLNTLLSNMSTDLRELRMVAQLRSPRR